MSEFVLSSDRKTLLNVARAQESYVIPSTVGSIRSGSIEDYAFYNAKDVIVSLLFASDSQITSIGDYSFYECQKLSHVDFSNAKKLEILCNFCFSNCHSITSIEFPSSLKELGYYGVFSGCSNLKYVTFPSDSQMTIINGGSFGYTAITHLWLPKSLSVINSEAFLHTPIVEFSIDEENDWYSVYNGSLFTKNFESLVCHQKGSPFNIPKSTTSIQDVAFSGFPYDIKLPSFVTSLSRWAFLGFNGKSLTLMSPIQTIKSRMFELGSKTKQLLFFDQVYSIEDDGISGQNLEMIYFLMPIKDLKDTSFDVNLKKVCFAWNVKAIQEAYFPQKIRVCPLYGIAPSCFQTVRLSKLLLPFVYILISTI